MNTTPTPAIFANKRPAVPAPPKPAAPKIAALVEPGDPGKIVRPGKRDQVVESIHDGVVKTKQLQVGQRVRPFVHNEPRGGERIISKAERLDDGAFWLLEFASGHPAGTFKAAYRWHDASLVGTTVQTVVQVPALVPYQES